MELATDLLRKVAEAGFIPSLTFHPGTQCIDPQAWEHYIRAAGDIARGAGVKIARLNVGGGFPSHRVTAEAAGARGDLRPDRPRRDRNVRR